MLFFHDFFKFPVIFILHGFFQSFSPLLLSPCASRSWPSSNPQWLSALLRCGKFSLPPSRGRQASYTHGLASLVERVPVQRLSGPDTAYLLPWPTEAPLNFGGVFLVARSCSVRSWRALLLTVLSCLVQLMLLYLSFLFTWSDQTTSLYCFVQCINLHSKQITQFRPPVTVGWTRILYIIG